MIKKTRLLKYLAAKKKAPQFRSLRELIDYAIEVYKPIPRYPMGAPSSPAVVGERGPDMSIGIPFTTESRLQALELPVSNIILAEKYIGKLKQSRARVYPKHDPTYKPDTKMIDFEGIFEWNFPNGLWSQHP